MEGEEKHISEILAKIKEELNESLGGFISKPLNVKDISEHTMRHINAIIERDGLEYREEILFDVEMDKDDVSMINIRPKNAYTYSIMMGHIPQHKGDYYPQKIMFNGFIVDEDIKLSYNERLDKIRELRAQLKEVELQLNYSCYDEHVLKKTQNVWKALKLED